MKKVIKNSIVTVAMLGAITNYANLVPSKPWSDDIKKTILNIDNVKEGHRLLIKDLNGVILYKESIEIAGNYNREFDLTSLPNGNYYFELEKDLEIKIIPFLVEASQVTFDKEATTTIYKPVVRVKNNLVYISRLTLNKESLDIELFYEGSGTYESIYSDAVSNTLTMKRVLSLDKNKKGNYKLVFKTEGRIFTEYFKI